MESSKTFGVLLKERRKMLDITQEELAEHAGCNYDYVRKIESGKRHPSKQFARRLGEELGLFGDRLEEFVRTARGGLPAYATAAFAPAREEAHTGAGSASGEVDREPEFPPTNLPSQRTNFIGRQGSVTKVSELLKSESVRLLTLTGPPGIGKSRLSFEVAAALRPDYADGVFFVPLAPVSDPNDVLPAITRELGIKEVPAQNRFAILSNYLREKKMLLVLDNFEQVLEAGEFIARILSACPGLKVIVSSREVLHVYGQQEYPVPPMELPDPEAEGMARGVELVQQSEAVQLFVERAQSVDPYFELTGGNAGTVAEICRRLDGLPLAIELAAARAKALPPQALLARLNKRLELLKTGALDLSPRQRTLRGAIDWSYDLLKDWEQVFFRRISVLLGATIDSAEAVCTLPAEDQYSALDGISTLLDKSLLRRLDSKEEEPHFWMLWMIREYAREKLAQSGEEAAVRRQHAHYFMQLAEEAEPHLTSAGRDPWMIKLDEEMDNLRAAMEWSLSDAGDKEVCLCISGALMWYWAFRGYLSEGGRWLEASLSQTEELRETAAGARALHALGRITWMYGDPGRARALLEESVEFWRSVGDKRRLAYALGDLAVAIGRQGDRSTLRTLQEQSVELFRETDDKWGLANALGLLSEILLDGPNAGPGMALSQESRRLFEELGDMWGVADQLDTVARYLLTERDYAGARSGFAQALSLQRSACDKWRLGHILFGLGTVEYCERNYYQALGYYEESTAVFRAVGDYSAITSVLRHLAHAQLAIGLIEQALLAYRQSLALAIEVNSQRSIAHCLAGMAHLLMTQGQVKRAARVYGLVHHVYVYEDVIGTMHVADRVHYDAELEIIQSRLAEPEIQAAWDEGHTLDLMGVSREFLSNLVEEG